MSFPRYDRYKDSGIEWLGMVPDHWRTVPLKSVSSHNDDVLHENKAPDSEILYVDITSVNYIDGISSKETFLFGESPSRARRCVKNGDVIISTVRTYLRAIACIRDPEDNLIVSTGFAVIRPGKELMPNFLGYFIKSNYFVEKVIARSSGVSYPAINASDLVEIPVLVPSMHEQMLIAEFLDRETAKIDEMVAEQRRLIELLKEKRLAIISHAITKGLNPNVPMKPSGIEWIGEVPDHWAIVPLKYVIYLRSGGTPRKENLAYWDGNVPWASSKDLKVESLYDTEDHITDKAIKDGEASLIPEGSIIIVVRGMILIHTFPVVKAMVPMAINQDLKAITTTEMLNADYLAWYLRGNSTEIIRRTDEAAHGTKVLRIDALTSMSIPIPPLEEQMNIVVGVIDHLAQLDRLTDEARSTIDLLQERRTALISAAVTGKIDVRGFVESEAV